MENMRNIYIKFYWKCGAFHQWVTPKWTVFNDFNGTSIYKSMIWGYPYVRKPQCFIEQKIGMRLDENMGMRWASYTVKSLGQLGYPCLTMFGPEKDVHFDYPLVLKYPPLCFDGFSHLKLPLNLVQGFPS